MQNVVFMSERDLCFIHALKSVASDWSLTQEQRPKRVLGVFGAGHLKGIQLLWNAAQE